MDEETRQTEYTKAVYYTLFIEDNYYTERIQTFSDSTCTTSSAAFFRRFTYTFKETNDSAFYEFDKQTYGGTAIFYNSAYATQVNTDSLCGDSIVFNTDAETNVTGKDCLLIDSNSISFGNIGDTFYDIIQIQTVESKEQLQFGDSSTGEGDSESTRPTALSAIIYYRTSY